jgi:hypothetical protein
MTTHAHDWVEVGDSTTACAVTGCQAMRHEHRYTQEPIGRWSCSCGAWTPKPPPQPDQAVDLSGYNVRPLTRRKPRTTRKPVRSR